MDGGDRAERESQIIDAFVDLADSLVEDYDPLDFLYRLLEHGLPLVSADAGGVLLEYQGQLHLVAASSEASEDVEVFEVQHEEGPARDAFRGGDLVRVDCLADEADRWPEFVPYALKAGWAAVAAFPLRLRDRIVGSFVVFVARPTPLGEVDAKLLRGFADVAAIAVVQAQLIAETEDINDQLHLALESRVKVEQAKGMVAERLHLTPGEAFQALRRHARSTNQALRDVAAAVVDGELDPWKLV